MRQGDPLSPLIFVLAADLLQASINDEFRIGNLQLPILMVDGDYPVIQYADGTVVIMPVDRDQVVRMKQILQDYAVSVGLNINFQKSTLIPINTPDDVTAAPSHILGCAIGTMPFTYLGLPMGTTRPNVNCLMPMVCSVERRLSTAASLLDYVSKLTLVNLVITSIAIYAMCSIKLPPR